MIKGTRSRTAAAMDDRVGVIGAELLVALVGDHVVVPQPLNCPHDGSSVAESVPGGHKLWVFSMKHVREPTKGTLALQRTPEPSPRLLVTDELGEVDHVLVPDPGRQRVDAEQSILGVALCVAIGVAVGVVVGVVGPEVGLAGQGVEQPLMLEAALVGQCRRQHLEVD
jgi:hypothetical protein